MMVLKILFKPIMVISFLGVILSLIGAFRVFAYSLAIIVILLMIMFILYKNGVIFDIICKNKIRSTSLNTNKDKMIMIGSSFFKRWITAENDFSGIDIINFGIDGTRIGDWIKIWGKTIIPYEPSSILLYIGSNDFNNKVSIEIVLKNIEKLLNEIKNKVPKIPIMYVAIAPTIARKDKWEQIKKFNNLVKELCESTSNLYFIDPTCSMLKADGSLLNDIYMNDNLHFNAKGYQYWSSAIVPEVSKIIKENNKKKST